MMRSQKKPTQLFSGIFCFFWTTALLTAVFSGLSHLPFAVRYGLVQTDARTTIWHYYAAAVLLMLGTYAVIIWWCGGRREFSFTRCGAIRTVLLVLLSLSGLGLMLHNLPDVAFFGSAYGHKVLPPVQRPAARAHSADAGRSVACRKTQFTESLHH